MSRYDRKDRFYDRAKAGGYRARSAYKLQELDDRFRVLRAGMHIVDLGAWPGAWLQVAAERIGTKGRAVGIDLAAITPLGLPHVATVTGDIRDPAAIAQVVEALGRPADVVLCDIAHKLTGVRATDESRRAELVAATLDTLQALLAPGGKFLIKLFMDDQYPMTVTTMRGMFRDVRATRPEATRPGSAELYVLGVGFIPTRDPQTCG